MVQIIKMSNSLKNILPLFASIVLLTSCATQPKTTLEKTKEIPVAETADDWYLFENEELDYSIQFPKAPIPKHRIMDTDLGDLQEKRFGCEMTEEGEGMLYIVSTLQFPLGIANSSMAKNLDDFFRYTIDYELNTLPGKLLSEKKIELDGFEGRAITIDYQDSLILVTMNIYFIGDRIYTLQTGSRFDKDKSLQINRFFNSFKVSEAYKANARKEVSTSETASGQQLYESKTGGYKIAFPKTPVEGKTPVESEMGKLDIYSASYVADEGMYTSVYMDYPDSLINSEMVDLEEFYAGVIEGSASNVNGKILYLKNITLNEIEGREVKISVEKQSIKVVTVMRLFLVANRMYILQTAADEEDVGELAKRFMDSFELIK